MVNLLLHHNYLTQCIALMGIIFSLSFTNKNYRLAFATRCFFIVMYAGSELYPISAYRFVDVIIGGFIGILCSAILDLQKKHNHC